MIIWRGWGILVAVIAFGCLFAADLLTGIAFKDDQYYHDHGWPKLVGFLVAAAIVGPVGLLFNRRTEDAEEGSRHSLFFVPMQYWAPILVVAGIVFYFL